MRVLLSLVFFAVVAASRAMIAVKTAGMKTRIGFYPLYWDEKGGNLFLEIERVPEEFRFSTSLAESVRKSFRSNET